MQSSTVAKHLYSASFCLYSVCLCVCVCVCVRVHACERVMLYCAAVSYDDRVTYVTVRSVEVVHYVSVHVLYMELIVCTCGVCDVVHELVNKLLCNVAFEGHITQVHRQLASQQLESLWLAE